MSRKYLRPDEVAQRYHQYYDFQTQEVINKKLQVWTLCPQCEKWHWSACTAIRCGHISSPICKKCIGTTNLPKEPVNRVDNKELLNRLKTRAVELGRNPKAAEVKGKNTIICRFGSWNEALYAAGLLPFSPHKETFYRPPFKCGPPPDTPADLGYFLAGLVAGEGCFSIARGSYKTIDRGEIESFTPTFTIGLHNSDTSILKTFLWIFPCGHIYRKTESINHFTAIGIENAVRYVIPFFRKFDFRNTFKQQQFRRWCEVVELLNQNAHLSPGGRERIKKKAMQINRR